MIHGNPRFNVSAKRSRRHAAVGRGTSEDRSGGPHAAQSAMAGLVEGQALSPFTLSPVQSWRAGIMRAAAQASPEEQEGIGMIAWTSSRGARGSYYPPGQRRLRAASVW